MAELTTWGSVSQLRYGKALPVSERDNAGMVRVFGTNGPIGYADTSQGDGPTVVVGRKGAYRGIHYSDGPFWVIDTAYFLELSDRVLPVWAYYCLLNTDINGLGSGSAIPSTTREDFYALPVWLPELPDQRAIAEVLGALDDKIAANADLVARTQELAVVLAATSMSSTTVGSLASHARISVNPQGIGAPIVDHYSLPAFDNGQLPEQVPPDEIKSNKFIIRKPAVLISKLNPRFPRVWDVATLPGLPALASTEFVVLEPHHVSTTVLWALLAQPSVGAALEGMVAGTSGSHQRVKPDAILAASVADPASLSQSVLDRITTLGQRAEQARVESRTLAATRDAILPGLMSGKLRVRNTDRIVVE